jgi:NAD(P)-dependent dehydrogenase (short-subunit alcohol dehydrogenase family)
MELGGSVVAITGGSRGFGLAIARYLVERGANVGLLARGRDSLAEAVALLGEAQALGLVADVANRAELTDALQSLKRHFGRLDALVNNAGLARPNSIEHLAEDQVALQVNTNFLGTVYASQAAIPLLRGAPDPRIINISSASAVHYDEMSHLSIYAATKAAVERFTRDLREELQPDGIGVSCVRPGSAWTTFSDGWDETALRAGLEAWHNSGPHMDTGMEVEQVAHAVGYCLEQPAGTAVDLLEVRPNRLAPKLRI